MPSRAARPGVGGENRPWLAADVRDRGEVSPLSRPHSTRLLNLPASLKLAGSLALRCVAPPPFPPLFNPPRDPQARGKPGLTVRRPASYTLPVPWTRRSASRQCTG